MGHSEAGKSTTVKLLQGKAEILCDDRNIIRRWPEGFVVHGTWSHGEVPLVSPASAPLWAILFLRKFDQEPAYSHERSSTDPGAVAQLPDQAPGDRRLVGKDPRSDGSIVREVPCYEMEFDPSGQIVPELRALVEEAP